MDSLAPLRKGPAQFASDLSRRPMILSLTSLSHARGAQIEKLYQGVLF
jgi:hypothetical protein